MRFEVVAAYVMGISLPALEIVRRRTNFENVSTYVDDIIVGALLLYAARAVTKSKANSSMLLVAAWAILVGGCYGSFFGQLNNTASLDVSGFSNSSVVIVKGVVFLTSIVALLMSIRSAARPTGHL